MKKKAILTVFIILVSTALIFFSKNMQRQQIVQQESNPINQPSAVNQEKPAEVKQDEPAKEETKGIDNTEANSSNQNTAKVEPASKTSADTSKTTDSSKTSKTQVKPETVQVPNLIISDILSKTVAFSGETVAQATIKALEAAKISYKTSTFGDAVYFSSINGIRERSAGPSSGWCYYVNGKKLSVGAGSYKLNKGDKLEWKFLKDGVSN